MMAGEGRNGGEATASVRISSQRLVHYFREVKFEDLISSLPDEILQHIFTFIPTKLAISTSILSKRWRHVWENTPSLSFDCYELDLHSIKKNLTRYKARKMFCFQFYIKTTKITAHDINRLIKFAISRDVENMWLNFENYSYTKYKIPDFFYINSIVKHITVLYADMIPRCSVSWPLLKTLSFHYFNLSDDESIAKILSGCPILETLKLSFSLQVKVLNLSKLLRLRKLEIDVLPGKVIDEVRGTWSPGPRKILAPQIHFLRLTNPQLACVLVDVSSLTEAKLDFCPLSLKNLKIGNHVLVVIRVQYMLEKLQNVQKLTFGEGFLKILSLAELYKFPFESLNVKDLTLETMISQYVIPSIVRLLQNSPELKKLTVHTIKRDTIPGEHLDKYFAMGKRYLDDRWSSQAKLFGKIFTRNVDPEYVASFMELMINSKTTETLEKMVLKLEDYHLTNRGLKELLQMVSVLAYDNNVSIVLSSTKPN